MRYILLSIIILGMQSCADYVPKQSDETEDCAGTCITEEPYYYDVIIRTSPNSLNDSVKVIIYNGFLESDIGIDTFWVKENEHTVNLPVNHYYTITAEYKTDYGKVTAIDGKNLEKYSYMLCDDTCWDVVGYEFDVRLKYK